MAIVFLFLMITIVGYATKDKEQIQEKDHVVDVNVEDIESDIENVDEWTSTDVKSDNTVSEDGEDAVASTEATMPAETTPKKITVDIDYELPDGYEAVVEEVLVLSDVNLRSRPGASSKSVTILASNSTVVRVGVGKNGWSAVVSNDQYGYVASYYLDPVEAKTITEVNDTVYANRDANIRSGPSIRHQKIGDAKENTAFIRTGIYSNGWSKIIYNGEEAYIYTLYITTESPNANFVDNANYKVVDEVMTASTKVNVRLGPGSSFVAIGTLQKGDLIHRVGIGDNGWSKVVYNGQDAYVSSKYLTETNANEPEA